MIRVLIVDDSATCRAQICDALAYDPEIEIVGVAQNGWEAVVLTARLRPNVVSMDIDMPAMNGVEATRHIMVDTPTPIVIVSQHANHSAVWAAEALGAGALAVLAKLPAVGVPGFVSERKRLADTLKSMSQVKLVRRRRQATVAAPSDECAKRLTPAEPVRAIAIAASTGGPSALREILTALPATFPVPVLVVQHICEGFLPGFAAWLDGHTSLRVKIAKHGEILESGTVYIAPDGHHLEVSRAQAKRAALTTAPRVNFFRPSASALFQSVADAYAGSAAGLVLTGMGNDGLAGLRALGAAGGLILAQDESTSVVFGMPGAVVAAGIANRVLPLDQIPQQLCNIVACGSTKGD